MPSWRAEDAWKPEINMFARIRGSRNFVQLLGIVTVSEVDHTIAGVVMQLGCTDLQSLLVRIEYAPPYLFS